MRFITRLWKKNKINTGTVHVRFCLFHTFAPTFHFKLHVGFVGRGARIFLAPGRRYPSYDIAVRILFNVTY